jgi:hypothetical protein
MQTPQDKAWYESIGIGTHEPKPYVKPIEEVIENDPGYIDLWAGEVIENFDHAAISEAFDMVTNA